MERWSEIVKYYQPVGGKIWQGRIDGNNFMALRWHQCVLEIDVSQSIGTTGKFDLPLPKLLDAQKGFAMIGFSCDEGVRRNLGRQGAAEGPDALRKACASFPVHFTEGTQLVDLGNIVCVDGDLDGAQAALAVLVSATIAKGYRPIVLGGGHEVTYGHYQGLVADGREVGIINFDAHFDLRIPGPMGPSSGTGFWQIAQNCLERKQPFQYLPIGIQRCANTQELYQTANQFGVNYVHAEDFDAQHYDSIIDKIDRFISGTNGLYVTVDLDVFSASYAPGVSAPATAGLAPDAFFLKVLRRILHHRKLIGLDVAELNPRFDIDGRTARLGAWIIFQYLSDQGLSGKP